MAHFWFWTLRRLSWSSRSKQIPGAMIHFGNAFEAGDEVIVDGMFQDNFFRQ